VTTIIKPRYLTKSRFKLAIECPTKLFYTGKREYADASLDDSFLAALAEGGFQVGALAQAMHPEGVMVDSLDHAQALEETAKLLERETVTIFEAALSSGDLFIRVDLLRKSGSNIQLIEVKAKSYSLEKDGDFYGAKGELKSEWRPYLLDIAFQHHVAQRALPGCRIRPYLMLADKDSRASIDGLNQLFKVSKEGTRSRVVLQPDLHMADLGTPVLRLVSVDAQVDEILSSKLPVGEGRMIDFPDAVALFAQAYRDDIRQGPYPSAKCSSCQFRTTAVPSPGGLRSGFHECWTTKFGLDPADYLRGTVLDLWNFRNKESLIQKGTLRTSQVTPADLDFDGEPPDEEGLTRKHRQWYFCQPDWPEGGDFYFDADGFRQDMSSWRYPLHFIDFETSAVALPFLKGRRPYETVAFQFSHHTMDVDGSVQHRSQWINLVPGADPTFDFVRALKASLEGDDGTIFRWSHHENTVLKQIRERLLTDDQRPADHLDLIEFIDQVTSGANGAGWRAMVDLCAIGEKRFFHPYTKGSTSLKKVLPALMQCSSFLRGEYQKANYGGPGVSLNFEVPIAWWKPNGSVVADPYSLLPPIFDDLSAEELSALGTSELDEIKEGASAATAYARLQFEDVPPQRRDLIRSALLRYCELDTLAMVMAVQAWKSWADA